MIDAAFTSVVTEMNEFLRGKFRLKDDRVVIATLVNQDGSQAVKEENRIIATLINIEEERLATPKYPVTGTRPVYLNLYILFSASFNPLLNVEALKFISSVIAFFQSKPLFEPQNTPGLGAETGIEKLVFEIYNLTLQEQSNMWASIGAKSMPSVLYRARMVCINESLMTYSAPAIEGMERSPEMQ